MKLEISILKRILVLIKRVLTYDIPVQHSPLDRSENRVEKTEERTGEGIFWGWRERGRRKVGAEEG